jgi:hypothetical protein
MVHTRLWPFFPRCNELARKRSNIFLKAGEKLSFRYRVLVHGGDPGEAKIADAFAKYKNEK